MKDKMMTSDKVAGIQSTTTSALKRESFAESIDLVCLSHLRWDFVYQRPQHLLSRCARQRRVFYFEEPIFDGSTARLEIGSRDQNIILATPHLPAGIDEITTDRLLQNLLNDLLESNGVEDYLLFYYSPMALTFSAHLKPLAVIYDCMDELSAFKGAPTSMSERENELFDRADIVFTGGRSLYEVKKNRHQNVHLFPSSVDVEHFSKARSCPESMPDQVMIPEPRIGFFGVIDERMNLDLLDGIAQARPDWSFVIIGPVVKIDPATLPVRPNLYYLGSKNYQLLPNYIAGWQAAMMPFALNESTRFISPTKTPEYMAAGKPVISVSIRDVVSPYGELGLVRIADNVDDFILAIEAALAEDSNERISVFDEFLRLNSWDQTWNSMSDLIGETLRNALKTKTEYKYKLSDAQNLTIA